MRGHVIVSERRWFFRIESRRVAEPRRDLMPRCLGDRQPGRWHNGERRPDSGYASTRICAVSCTHVAPTIGYVRVRTYDKENALAEFSALLLDYGVLPWWQIRNPTARSLPQPIF